MLSRLGLLQQIIRYSNSSRCVWLASVRPTRDWIGNRYMRGSDSVSALRKLRFLPIFPVQILINTYTNSQSRKILNNKIFTEIDENFHFFKSNITKHNAKLVPFKILHYALESLTRWYLTWHLNTLTLFVFIILPVR